MIRLTQAPFEPGALLAEFSRGRRETGAIVSFTGLVRAEGGDSEALELEAYPGFTEAAIERIAMAAKARFSLQDLMVVHRIGRVGPGEPIVFVAAAAVHRRAAFEGADHLMDYLKSRAPFWKKSIGAGGERWIEPRPQDYEDAARWDERAPGSEPAS
ncbi:MAG TPA: molybdenum cofactor biosynthesis protein MoaE [Caulobacteraceae bacterium]|nr:molybdenum cofactor biosynthesis protein MoaE [Caulobacteraceae bacterium]